jgi:polyisoprenoid-binding protein YceI
MKILRKILLATMVLAPAIAAAADTYTVDRTHSEVTFRVKHLVAWTPGTFRDYAVHLELEPADMQKSTVEFTIQTASIDTSNEDRDKHLRGDDFFAVDRFPTIAFKSESIKKTGENTYDVTGTLTMRDVSKKMTLPVEFNGFSKDPWGNEKAGFGAQFTLNRKDFGLVWNKTLDAGGLLLGDEVRVVMNLEMNKKKQ